VFAEPHGRGGDRVLSIIDWVGYAKNLFQGVFIRTETLFKSAG
jgi:hypothetical protein